MNVKVINNSIDLIYSQVVMEHVIDVSGAYKTMYTWLKNDGYMSHEIDYSAHETHKLWYGHWTYPKWLWKIIQDGRLYAINRYPNSYHIKTLNNHNFKVVFQLPYRNVKAKSISSSLMKMVSFTDNDLTISSCYIISKK